MTAQPPPPAPVNLVARPHGWSRVLFRTVSSAGWLTPSETRCEWFCSIRRDKSESCSSRAVELAAPEEEEEEARRDSAWSAIRWIESSRGMIVSGSCARD